MNNLTPEQLAFRAGYEQGRFDAQVEAAQQQEPVRLRRGNILRCIETDELCTVWSTSTTGKTLVKWNANEFGDYTAEQIGELFWLEPEPDDLELAAEKSDNYAAFHAGYRFAVAHSLAEQPAQQRHISYVCPQCHWSLDKQPAQQQEPAAWRYKKEGGGWFVSDNEPQYVEQWNDIEEIQPLYTSPPASKQWVGLTDEEIADIEITWEATQEWACFRYAARAIEAKLKDKNYGNN